MNENQEANLDSVGQSVGCDPKTSSASRRNSGLFSFLKWFKPSTSRESIDCGNELQLSQSSSSCDSLSSSHSTGTVASFSFIPASAYKKCVSEKCIVLGPETDTYKARLKQRDKRREHDKNLTLRKKYNLFFNRDTLLKPKPLEEEENTKSLPLMTRPTIEIEEEAKMHRRTFSESSKVKKAGSYVHVKGKRRAPQPPGWQNQEGNSTLSLRRKKRLAPTPPVNAEKVIKVIRSDDVLCNDSLKLDHGVLKPAKALQTKCPADEGNVSPRSSVLEAPVSPRPWYKRHISKEHMAAKKEKIELTEKLPDVPFKRNSTLDLTVEEPKKKDEKRKSGMSFLTNISELDREASEIIKNKEKNGYDELAEMPEFMRPKETKTTSDSWVSPKRRSAKDLIAKFNAITNVTKVTVFGASQRDQKLFGKQISLDETRRRQETILESHKKRIEEIDKKNTPLMKSESASAIKTKPETPKVERKSWKCPKCNLENDYWRIICHVCSAIKPYFDDFSSTPKSETRPEVKTSSPLLLKKEKTPPQNVEPNFERSKTQIGFSALANYNANRTKPEKDEVSLKDADAKKEEKERLKKMLIEMKNSLPKRKSNIMLKQGNRASIIVENPEEVKEERVNPDKLSDDNVELVPERIKEEGGTAEKTQEEKVAEILIGTTQTIYENIKVRKTDNPKPVKVSSGVQTSGGVKQILPGATVTNLVKDQDRKNTYELMRPKDFEDIYSDAESKSAARIYANLARNDELSLFFNMPKSLHFDNGRSNAQTKNTDTIEINRLLKRLETSIAKGELTEAAIFAKELAQLKVNCSVIRHKPQTAEEKKGIQIEMYVEDKISHRGPFPLNVTPDFTVANLKKLVEKEYEIPVEYQRWILGKELVTRETSTLKDHNITDGCPVFLYLVQPEQRAGDTAIDTRNVASTSKASPQEPMNMNKPTIECSRTSNISNDERIEKMKLNVQNLQNLLGEGRRDTKNDLLPKIVNVIPKAVDNKSTKTEKTEIARVIPIEIENKTENRQDIPQAAYLTEIVIEEKVVPSSNNEDSVDIKIEKNASSSPKQEISLEVKPKIQYVFPTIQNAYETQVDEVVIPIKEEVKEQPKQFTVQQKLGAVPKYKSQSGLKSTALKTTEEVSEDYDCFTLKAEKEWECHLCTLLNPVNSNVCAVCATVRINKPIRKHVKKRAPQPSDTKAHTYQQLVHLDNADLVENQESFECLVCFAEIHPHQGVTLRECLHQFCKACLANTIEFNEEAEVKCPYRDDEYSCNIALQDREIKALVSADIYEQYLAKSVAQAENRIEGSFHCKTPDCKGWCIFEDNVNEFKCPVCRQTNCLTCQAIHPGQNCKQYQERMAMESEVDENARRTRLFLQEMVNKGEAIKCPTCKVVLMKKWGCDWLRCSVCKTEICWVTRGPRWGPEGKGDISAGCRCGVNGIKCHPNCNYCH